MSVSVYMSSELEGKMLKMVEELAERCVLECASRYGFDGEEACRLLGLSMLKFERKSSSKVLKKEEKRATIAKASFPLPYNGEFAESCCYALRQNNGLYTQCQGSRRNGSDFCKSCITTMSKTGSEIPEYGTIQGRKAVDIFEYVDPKGRKPIAYTKVMKKYKITEEQVMEEAGKLNIVINPMHFVAPEETKRGRPATNKEPKEKGVKGRPKKEKKVIELGGDDDDLFATLVANANVEEEEILPKESEAEKEAKKEAKKAEKEAEKEAKKAEKEAKLAAEKAEKEAKKAEKEAKLAAEKAEKEAKLAAEKAEKEAKKAAEKEAKKAAEKEAKKAAEKEAKKPAEKKTESTPKAAAEEEDEQPERVKKIEFEGKKYLMSKKSGVIYDYDIYISENDLVNVGVWNETTKKIDFTTASEVSDEESGDESGEESEDEYDD
jgi:hypothetical protein